MSYNLTITPQVFSLHTKYTVTIRGGEFDDTTAARLVRPGYIAAVSGFGRQDDGGLSAQVPCNEIGIYEVHIRDEGSGLKLRLKLVPETVPVRNLVRSAEGGSTILDGEVIFQYAGVYNLVVETGGNERVLPGALTVTEQVDSAARADAPGEKASS